MTAGAPRASTPDREAESAQAGQAPTTGHNGRNRVSQKALRRMAEVIAAEELGVKPAEVAIDLADDGGLLGVTASLPISVHSLAPARRSASRPAKPTTSVLDRAAAAQSAVRDRMLHLTGSTVGAVNLRLTAARTEGGERR
jgi:hypothetical protein